MTHPKPTEEEISAYSCLEFVLHQRVYLHGVAKQRGCSLNSLKHLESIGFIEQVHDICMPLEMSRTYYRVTPAGKIALDCYRANKAKQ